MRKTILAAFSMFCFMALITACGDTGSETTTKTDSLAVDTGQRPGVSPLRADGTCEGCTDADPCGTTCLGNILECHHIEPGEFQTRTTGSGFSGIGHSPHSVSEICTMAADADCATQFIWIDGKHEKPEIDSDITFEVKNRLGSTPVTYEIALFRAICDRHPQDIKFYKAKREGSTDDDIIIKVTYSATDIVHYDLSDAPTISAQSSTSQQPH